MATKNPQSSLKRESGAAPRKVFLMCIQVKNYLVVELEKQLLLQRALLPFPLS